LEARKLTFGSNESSRWSCIGGPRVERHFHAGQVEWPARTHVDLAGEAGLDLVRRTRLVHVDAADDVGRHVLQREAAADAGEYVAAVPGGGAVGQAADGDAVRFAAAAVGDLNAGDALQGFDDVVVGQLADVFSDDRLEHLGGFFLVLEAFRKRFANAGDDHRLHFFAFRRLSGRCLLSDCGSRN
jgi:hypothetical protein